MHFVAQHISNMYYGLLSFVNISTSGSDDIMPAVDSLQNYLRYAKA